AGGAGNIVGLGPRTASRRRGAHKNDLCSLQRRDRCRYALPRVLAHEHGCAPPRRIERANRAPTLDKSLFVEQSVRWEEHLAMNLANTRLAVAEVDVHGAVVQLVVPDFVEPKRDVERLAGRRARA